jgi:DNA modification methylase
VIHWQDDHLTLYGGDCRTVLRELPAESVHCVVTSPPYWGLRDYGTADQLGLEPTPEAYVENMVAVFREVRRVLRADGTLWLNLGDSYYTTPAGNKPGTLKAASGLGNSSENLERRRSEYGNDRQYPGLKMKDLVGIPWRVAFALQADGWYLRSDIIWSKPNPMPESVTDRPTKAHEYLFLLTKSPRYYFDADAVREDALHAGRVVKASDPATAKNGQKGQYGATALGFTQHDTTVGAGRNLRSVWTIATEPYPGAHFATFPRKLVEPCVKAGTSERGVCPECGAPWVREVEKGELVSSGPHAMVDGDLPRRERTEVGWRPSCDHDAEPVPAVVLDPFAGSGTTLFVAQALGRRGVGIDLNPDYLKQALTRNAQTPLGLIG